MMRAMWNRSANRIAHYALSVAALANARTVDKIHLQYGKKTNGVIRSTVWIGPDGKVERPWRRVARAADHPQKVFEALQLKLSD